MAFAIMRCAKLKSMGNIAASLQHAYRERDTPNADDERTPDNEHFGQVSSTDQAMGKMRELLPEKRRKDAVLCVEYLMTASPEWWKTATEQEQAKFFGKAHAWAAKKYGSDRIISAVIHRDEKTPHLSLHVVPLTEDGRLSAKQFIGNKKQMSQDQDTFAATMEPLGLVRGVKGSKAKHQTVRAYYAALQEPSEAYLTVSPDEVTQRKTGMLSKEPPEEVAKRITQRLRRDDDPRQARLMEAEKALKQNEELKRELGNLSYVRQAFSDLSLSEQKEALRAGLRASREKEAEETRKIREKTIRTMGAKKGKSDDVRYARHAVDVLDQHGIKPTGDDHCHWLKHDIEFTLFSLMHGKKVEHVAMTLNRMSPRYIGREFSDALDEAKTFERLASSKIEAYQKKHGINQPEAPKQKQRDDDLDRGFSR